MNVNSTYYTVQAAAASAGVSAHTLRMWESRYEVVAPARSASGHRRYREVEVQRLRKIAALVRRGHAIGQVAQLSDVSLDGLLASRQPTTHHDELKGAAHVQLTRLFAALETFQIVEVVARVKWLRAALGMRAFVFDVAVPLFSRIGMLVADSKLDICQEHALSAVLRDQLGDAVHSLQALTFADRSLTETIVFATPEDDLHEFGILLSAALAVTYGFEVYYAGANLPAKSLAAGVRATRAKRVVLGNAPVPATERRQAFPAYLGELDSLLPKDVALVIGGAGDRPRAPSEREVTYIDALDDFDLLLARNLT